jgi:alkylation response protein AidB-like acyl-CoA dehydrogenase
MRALALDGSRALQLPPECERLRGEVRKFLRERAFVPRADSWMAGFDAEFSHELGRCGWLGMTWPIEYGGHGRSALERYVVIEELLAAGAPVAAHWVGDRQTGPTILRFGSEMIRRRFLPAMAQGRCFSALGLSEPDAGSDLASVRTRASRVEGGWLLNGTKVWTSHAHRAHILIVLARTSRVDSADRHHGLTEFIVEIPQTPGLTIRPIELMTAERHFNEVVLNDVFVPDDLVLGQVDGAWHQVIDELAYERSGPERFLSTFLVVPELARLAAESGDPRATSTLAKLWSDLWTMRRLSLAVTVLLDRGESPELEAALVKSMGTELEQEIVELARTVLPAPVSLGSTDSAVHRVAEALLHTPAYTLRGGTNEVLRGIVARGLGLR